MKNLPTYVSKNMKSLLTLSKEGVTDHLKIYLVVWSFHDDFVRTKCRYYYQNKLHIKCHEKKKDSGLTQKLTSVSMVCSPSSPLKCPKR
jgi:hypothetical protein